jgi:hypothetical protein
VTKKCPDCACNQGQCGEPSPSIKSQEGHGVKLITILAHLPLASAQLHTMTCIGPMALKLRPDLIEGVEMSLCFRFNIWPWQFMAKRDEKALCEHL